MSSPRSTPPLKVPTLTEVVEPPRLPAAGVQAPHEPPAEQAAAPHEPGAELVASRSEPHAIDEAQLIERILADLQRQVELMLEYRLREVLAPTLARASESLIRDARVELASTLRDVVARAVAQELLRHRGR